MELCACNLLLLLLSTGHYIVVPLRETFLHKLVTISRAKLCTSQKIIHLTIVRFNSLFMTENKTKRKTDTDLLIHSKSTLFIQNLSFAIHILCIVIFSMYTGFE